MHSSILASEIPRTEEPDGLPSIELQRELDMTEQPNTYAWQLKNHFHRSQHPVRQVLLFSLYRLRN